MNNQGSAIYCLYCKYDRRGELLNVVLGSVTNDGVLIIKRAHNLVTKINFTQTLTVYCDCGYEAIINPSFKQTDYGKQI